MALPTKKALPVFLYTKDVKLIDAVPNTASATYNIGDIISFAGSETGTGGYYQGTEINVLKGELHDPTYTNKATLKFLGVMAEKYPVNFFLYTDQDGDLDNADYDLGTSVQSFAGSLSRMTVNIMPNFMIMDFWDSTAGGQAAEALIASDIGADVFASQTVGGDIGKAGKSSLARSNPNSVGAIKLGTLGAIPISGGRYGYVLLDTLGAR